MICGTATFVCVAGAERLAGPISGAGKRHQQLLARI